MARPRSIFSAVCRRGFSRAACSGWRARHSSREDAPLDISFRQLSRIKSKLSIRLLGFQILCERLQGAHLQSADGALAFSHLPRNFMRVQADDELQDQDLLLIFSQEL